MKIRHLQKKHILKKAVANLLPEGVLKHRKQGFVGPMSRWLQTDLKEYAQGVLNKKVLDAHGIFNPKRVHDILEDHYGRKQIHDRLIWSLVIFQTWYNLYIANNQAA